jgi:hypothetical protein
LETAPAPDTVLTTLLRDLGAQPDPAASLADQVRAQLRERPALLIADGAENAPPALDALLDCAGAGALLVTTRDQRVPRGQRRAKRLEPLSEDEAAGLLADLLAGDDPALAAIAERLGRLPLALEIAAADMAAETPPAEYLADLRTGALAHLADVRAAFQRSYERLDAEARRAFALLGLFGGESFDLAAAAAGLDAEPPAARAALGTLVSRCLLARDRDTGRYHAHPLLKEHTAAVDADDRAAMQARLDAHHLAYALQYDNQQTAAAYDALEAELANLLAVLDRAEAGQEWAAMRDLTWPLYWLLDTRGYWAELQRRLTALATACQALDDRAGLATTYNNIGEIHHARGEYETALAQHQKALALREALGDQYGRAPSYNNIGLIHNACREWPQALALYERSLEILERIGARPDAEIVRQNLALARRAAAGSL